jgi:hypothetical protein
MLITGSTHVLPTSCRKYGDVKAIHRATEEVNMIFFLSSRTICFSNGYIT